MSLTIFASISQNSTGTLCCLVIGSTERRSRCPKTELSVEPIRGFRRLLRPDERILHLEFQVEVVTVPRYRYANCVRLKKTGYPVEQVVILKSTTKEAAYVEQFTDSNTVHRASGDSAPRPCPSSSQPHCCPAASLAASESPVELLNRVAPEVGRERKSRPDGDCHCALGILAGYGLTSHQFAKYSERLCGNLCSTKQIVREGVEQGELAMVLRQLRRRIGAVETELLSRFRRCLRPRSKNWVRPH